MALPDCFDPKETETLLDRMASLAPGSAAHWGKMDAAQMLAHCCIPYQQIQGELGGGPAVLRFIARHFLKQAVVGEAPFKRSLPTAKAFRVADAREFERERQRLGAFIRAVHGQGAAAFEGRLHVAYGPLTARQWSNLLWKHLDHHLRQFGV
jgi:Protein of unknown function (DUF1569)